MIEFLAGLGIGIILVLTPMFIIDIVYWIKNSKQNTTRVTKN